MYYKNTNNGRDEYIYVDVNENGIYLIKAYKVKKGLAVGFNFRIS